MKRLLIGAAALLAALVMIVLVVVLVWDWGWVLDRAERAASDRTGRETTFGGLDVAWDWSTPRLVLTDVVLANPSWAERSAMFEAERVEAVVRLWDLVRGEVVLPELVLQRPVLALEATADGEVNWDFGGDPEAAAATEVVPEDRSEMPAIGRLVIEEGRLSYVDAARDIEIEGAVSTAVGEADEEIALSGEGRFEGRPFTLDLRGGSVLALRDEDRPYPLAVDVRIGDTAGTMRGTLTAPFALTGMNVDFVLEGDDMAEVFPIFGIPLPPTRPYRLEGRLDHEGTVWRFTDFAGSVGDSDLRGDLAVDTGPEPPGMTADLRSRRLDFNDLAGFIGADPHEESGALEDGRLLPETPVDLERLRAMNMDVRLVAERIEAPGYALDGMDATLHLRDGLARVDPLRFGIANGVMAGSLVLDGRADSPAAALDVTMKRIAIAEFFAGSGFAREMGGLIEGRIELGGTGASLADMLGRGDGRLAMVMTDGTISAVMVELSGLDIAEFLALEITEDDVRVPIDCLAVDFDVTDGIGTSRTLLLDTSDSFVAGQGRVNLAEETLDLEFVSDPKDFSLLSLNAPIYVDGPFVDPAVSVGAEAVLPKIDFGDDGAGAGLCGSLKDTLE